MHRLLMRQLKRYGDDGIASAPKDWPSFVAAVDAAYASADEDLLRVERSLDLMSDELNERNRKLHAEIAQRQKIEEQLKSSIRQLERKNKQISQLNAMGEMLQSCRSLDHAYHIIANELQKLFLTRSGAIAVRDEASDTLLPVATWGKQLPLCKAAVDKQCPALSAENQEGSTTEKSCLRRRRGASGHLCIRLATRGQQIGMIHVRLKSETLERSNDTAIDDHQQLVQTTSDHISLALANLRLQDSLRQQTLHDALTGLYNRRHMEVSLERECCRARRAVKPLGIIMLDIDHFKRFNDRYGHQAGDEVLTALGAFLNRQIRGEDIACRYGGEEFILIMPGADLANTRRRAEQICRDVPRTLNVEFEGHALGEITISVGVSCFPVSGIAHHDVVKAADIALYEAKRGGRNRVVAAA